MKAFKHEAKLLKKALQLAEIYAKQHGYAKFPPGTSEKDKVEAFYLLLSQDKQITPLPKDKYNGPEIRHKLVIWLANQLPKGHSLLES